ncbi:hypothetical protein ILYODFUR_010500 [Ilyodon furcidens]|uniref:Uncharacterized protein n=1 Tax=Ilyodon furcidens TaxID=33524 RepID=A0ABV0TTT6_9TELE
MQSHRPYPDVLHRGTDLSPRQEKRLQISNLGPTGRFQHAFQLKTVQLLLRKIICIHTFIMNTKSKKCG